MEEVIMDYLYLCCNAFCDAVMLKNANLLTFDTQLFGTFMMLLLVSLDLALCIHEF